MKLAYSLGVEDGQKMIKEGQFNLFGNPLNLFGNPLSSLRWGMRVPYRLGQGIGGTYNTLQQGVNSTGGGWSSLLTRQPAWHLVNSLSNTAAPLLKRFL